jgi:glycosyltransferase involved in cell wall biosynthesis
MVAALQDGEYLSREADKLSLITFLRGILRSDACRYINISPAQTVVTGSATGGMCGVRPGEAKLSKPLVSVIVPAFNAEKTIRECVESILQQSFDDFEVLIVNDGSVDSTAELAAELASFDSRIQIIDQPNLGVSAARNRGLRAARGQFVCVLDADDIWVTDKLESQLAVIGDDQDMVVICGLRRFVDNENGRVWLAESMPPCIDDQQGCLGTVMHLPSTSMNLIGTMLAPRRHLLEMGGWDERLKTGEDWDMWLRLSSRVRFRALNKTLSFYRKHEASATRGHDVMWVLGQHLSILDGCIAHQQQIDRRTINSAKMVRLLEGAGNLIYDRRLVEAAKVLIRSARYGCVWRKQQFYVRIKELLQKSLQQLTFK